LPVGGFVTGALEAFDVGEGLGEQGKIAVFFLPLAGQISQGDAHGAGGEVGHARLGEHEEAVVLDDEAVAFGSLAFYRRFIGGVEP